MSGKMEGTQVNENGCGGHHNHQHEHDHHNHHGGSRVIMGSSDGHILGTMTAYTPASLPVAVMNMELSMKDASVFIKENGGVPLEIKASLKDTSSTVILNLVGTEIFRSENQESTESDASRVKCKLLAAAQSCSHDHLCLLALSASAPPSVAVTTIGVPS